MIYEYQCQCGLKFEARKPMDERQTAVCPKCNKVAPKVFSVFNATYTWVLDNVEGADVPRKWHDPYK